MTEVPKSADNETRSILWPEVKSQLARQHVFGQIVAGHLWLESNVAEDIRNGVVAMGETLLSCCLYGEFMARRHLPALVMMSCTSFTHGYLKYREIATSHISPF